MGANPRNNVPKSNSTLKGSNNALFRPFRAGLFACRRSVGVNPWKTIEKQTRPRRGRTIIHPTTRVEFTDAINQSPHGSALSGPMIIVIAFRGFYPRKIVAKQIRPQRGRTVNHPNPYFTSARRVINQPAFGSALSGPRLFLPRYRGLHPRLFMLFASGERSNLMFTVIVRPQQPGNGCTFTNS